MIASSISFRVLIVVPGAQGDTGSVHGNDSSAHNLFPSLQLNNLIQLEISYENCMRLNPQLLNQQQVNDRLSDKDKDKSTSTQWLDGW